MTCGAKSCDDTMGIDTLKVTQHNSAFYVSAVDLDSTLKMEASEQFKNGDLNSLLEQIEQKFEIPKTDKIHFCSQLKCNTLIIFGDDQCEKCSQWVHFAELTKLIWNKRNITAFYNILNDEI